jgi:hypothetical protein
MRLELFGDIDFENTNATLRLFLTQYLVNKYTPKPITTATTNPLKHQDSYLTPPVRLQTTRDHPIFPKMKY